jgi:hypothetical protein
VEMGFHEGARGRNTWLVVPEDAGVFAGVEERGGIRCMSPVQTYLDTKGQPERGDEARLRRPHRRWTSTRGASFITF